MMPLSMMPQWLIIASHWIVAIMRAALLTWQPATVTPRTIVGLKYAFARCVRVAGVGAWPTSRAIIVKPVPAIKPGRCQLGMTNAAPAGEGELDGLELVHHTRPVFSGLEMNA